MAGLYVPYRRFAAPLAENSARLGADADRYSFIAMDFHHLIPAGLPALRQLKLSAGGNIDLMKSPTMLFWSVAAFASCNPAFSTTPPPAGPPYDAITWPMSMRHAPSGGITLGNFRIVYTKTTLETVAAAIGFGSISYAGDGAEAVSWLCDSIVTPHRLERLWLMSSLEMDGHTNAISIVKATRQATSDLPKDCPRLPMRFIPVSLDTKIWLGSTTKTLTRELGAPSHEARPWLNYEFQTKVTDDGQCEGGYDRINSLDVKVNDGAVVALSTDDVTSC